MAGSTRPNRLYERWLEVAGTRDRLAAVGFVSTGETLDFRTLARLGREAEDAPVVFRARPTGLDLLVDVLRAWRNGAVLLADESGRSPLPAKESLPSDVCHLKVTSGSTGVPKVVMFGAAELEADARRIVETMGLSEASPNLGVISLAHSYGFSNLVLPLLLHGVPLWLADNPLPETIRRTMVLAPYGTLPAVPALWRAWEQAGVDFSAVRMAVSAGANLPLSLEQEVFRRTGLKIHNFLGSSETGGIAFDSGVEPRTDPDFAGHGMPGVGLSLDVESGCLVVASDAVAAGYSEPDPSLGSGRFVTRDLARLGPGGEVHLLGRSGDVVNVAGYKVSPVWIEQALAGLPGVRACVAFGVPSADPVRVEDLVACVNAAEGLALDTMKAALAGLPSACQPRHWWICRELRPDGRGKIPRAQWRGRWLESGGGCLRLSTPGR